MLAIIVGKINASPTMSATAQQAGLDPLELYEAIKIGSKWYVKATDKHLKAAKALQLAHRQPNPKPNHNDYTTTNRLRP